MGLLTVEEIKPFVDIEAMRRSGATGDDTEIALVLQTAVTCANNLVENMLPLARAPHDSNFFENRREVAEASGLRTPEEASLSNGDSTLVVWRNSFASSTSGHLEPAVFEVGRVIEVKSDGRPVIGSLTPLFDLTERGDVASASYGSDKVVTSFALPAKELLIHAVIDWQLSL